MTTTRDAARAADRPYLIDAVVERDMPLLPRGWRTAPPTAPEQPLPGGRTRPPEARSPPTPGADPHGQLTVRRQAGCEPKRIGPVASPRARRISPERAAPLPCRPGPRQHRNRRPAA